MTKADLLARLKATARAQNSQSDIAAEIDERGSNFN